MAELGDLAEQGHGGTSLGTVLEALSALWRADRRSTISPRRPIGNLPASPDLAMFPDAVMTQLRADRARGGFSMRQRRTGGSGGWGPGVVALAASSGCTAEGSGSAEGDAGLCPKFQEKEPGDPRLGQAGQPGRRLEVEGGKAFEYRKDGKAYRYDIAARKAEELKPGKPPSRTGRRPAGGVGAGGPGSGPAVRRRLASPDGTLKAFYRDRNLWIGDPNGIIELAVTTDGSEKDRIKNGKASWVYGEELAQNTAFWWSPDGKKLAYYRFDEAKVADYYLQLDQSKVQDTLAVEPYPKAGRATRSPTCSSTT